MILTVGGGGGIKFIWSENIFQKFLDKTYGKEEWFGSGNIFPENSIALLRINWYFPYF